MIQQTHWPERLPSYGNFLAEYAESGRVGASAKAAGVSTATIYRWKEEDPFFSEKWSEAWQTYTEKIHDALNEAMFVPKNQRKYGGNVSALAFAARKLVPIFMDEGNARPEDLSIPRMTPQSKPLNALTVKPINGEFRELPPGSTDAPDHS